MVVAALLRKNALASKGLRLVLASGSPRRRELLQLLGTPFDVVTSGFPEDLDKSRYTPAEYVVANAREKCKAVLSSLPAADGDGHLSPVVIGADTVVTIDGKILEKPPDSEGARQMLGSLAGRTHEVFTGIAIAVKGRDEIHAIFERTVVTFNELTTEDIDAYIATGEAFDKAGGYGIQSQGSLLVKGIQGDYFNVVGLPVSSLARLISEKLLSDGDSSQKVESVAKRQKVEIDGKPPFIDKLALVLVKDRKQLVARSYGKSTYYTPGGKREKGETDEEALVREIKEEMNVDIDVSTVKPYGVFRAQAHGKTEGLMVRLQCFTAEFSGTPTASNEIEELRWISSKDRDVNSASGKMLLDDLKAKDLID